MVESKKVKIKEDKIKDFIRQLKELTRSRYKHDGKHRKTASNINEFLSFTKKYINRKNNIREDPEFPENKLLDHLNKIKGNLRERVVYDKKKCWNYQGYR